MHRKNTVTTLYEEQKCTTIKRRAQYANCIALFWCKVFDAVDEGRMQFNGLRVNVNGMHFAAVTFGAWSYAALTQKLATRS